MKDEFKALTRALTELVREVTRYLRGLEHPKDKGHLVFRGGQVVPKTINKN